MNKYKIKIDDEDDTTGEITITSGVNQPRDNWNQLLTISSELSNLITLTYLKKLKKELRGEKYEYEFEVVDRMIEILNREEN